jgi:hypothetical protein
MPEGHFSQPEGWLITIFYKRKSRDFTCIDASAKISPVERPACFRNWKPSPPGSFGPSAREMQGTYEIYGVANR